MARIASRDGGLTLHVRDDIGPAPERPRSPAERVLDVLGEAVAPLTRRELRETPDRFASFAEALAFCREFFAWYNHEHRHSGLAFFTPSAVHHGKVEQLAAIRNDALAAAYALHPERFVHGPPSTRLPPEAVYINPPEDITKSQIKGSLN